MTVFRNATARNYFASSRTWLQDRRLSNSARGLLAFLLSMPSHWDFNQKWMAENLQDKKDAIRSQLRELVKFGYVTRFGQQHDERGKFSSESEWIVYDAPQFTSPLTEEILDKLYSKKLKKQEIEEILTKAEIPISEIPTSKNPPLEDKHSTIEDKQRNKNISQTCPESPEKSSKTSSSTHNVKIFFDWEKKKFQGIEEEDILRWADTYQSIDVIQIIKHAENKIAAEPRKYRQRKKLHLTLLEFFQRQNEAAQSKKIRLDSDFVTINSNYFRETKLENPDVFKNFYIKGNFLCDSINKSRELSLNMQPDAFEKAFVAFCGVRHG